MTTATDLHVSLLLFLLFSFSSSPSLLLFLFFSFSHLFHISQVSHVSHLSLFLLTSLSLSSQPCLSFLPLSLFTPLSLFLTPLSLSLSSQLCLCFFLSFSLANALFLLSMTMTMTMITPSVGSLCTHSSDLPWPDCGGRSPFVDWRLARSVQTQLVHVYHSCAGLRNGCVRTQRERDEDNYHLRVLPL